MAVFNIVWPYEVHPAFKQRIEAILADCLAHFQAENSLCHAGSAEVHIADSYPMGRHLDTVVVCACGVPCATLEGFANESGDWKFMALAHC